MPNTTEHEFGYIITRISRESLDCQIEIFTETNEKIYSIFIAKDMPNKYAVNCKPVNMLPVTQKTKRLLILVGDNMPLITKILTSASIGYNDGLNPLIYDFQQILKG